MEKTKEQYKQELVDKVNKLIEESIKDFNESKEVKDKMYYKGMMSAFADVLKIL